MPSSGPLQATRTSICVCVSELQPRRVTQNGGKCSRREAAYHLRVCSERRRITTLKTAVVRIFVCTEQKAVQPAKEVYA
jgi:hypothetical protein